MAIVRKTPLPKAFRASANGRLAMTEKTYNWGHTKISISCQKLVSLHQRNQQVGEGRNTESFYQQKSTRERPRRSCVYRRDREKMRRNAQCSSTGCKTKHPCDVCTPAPASFVEEYIPNLSIMYSKRKALGLGSERISGIRQEQVVRPLLWECEIRLG
jgi:hypothetical protein